jgi:serine/threonine protein kinase
MKMEVSALSAFQFHPNIVGFYGVTQIAKGIDDVDIDLPCLGMQIEYCNGGDLHDRVVRSRFDEEGARDVMQQILRGLSHIHELGYVHRDIKPENVLWADGVAKIADFGLCCHISDKKEMKRRCGSPGYMAPEAILGHAYGPNVDCFSAGALLHFILSGKLAFGGHNQKRTLQKTLSFPINFRKSLRLECLSTSCKELMLELTEKDQSTRPTSTEALKSLWLSEGCLVSEANPTSCAAPVSFSSEHHHSIQHTRRKKSKFIWTEEDGEIDGAMCSSACPRKSFDSSFDKLRKASKASKASTASLETADTKGTYRQSFSRRTRESFPFGSERYVSSSTEEEKNVGNMSFTSSDLRQDDGRSSNALSDVLTVSVEMSGRKAFRCVERESFTSPESVRIGEDCIDIMEPKKPEGQPARRRMPSFLRARRGSSKTR